MKRDKKLSLSLENYLRAIYFIVTEKKAARVKDISGFLHIGASSVSEALKNLADKELINYEPYGIITLTEKGEKYAAEIVKRHDIISNFLENVLSVDKAEADENANNIEFGVSDPVLVKFVRFLEFMDTCACKEPKWIKSYKAFAENADVSEKCTQCIKKASADGKTIGSCCG